MQKYFHHLRCRGDVCPPHIGSPACRPRLWTGTRDIADFCLGDGFATQPGSNGCFTRFHRLLGLIHVEYSHWPLAHCNEVCAVSDTFSTDDPPLWSSLLSLTTLAVALRDHQVQCLNCHETSHYLKQCSHPFISQRVHQPRAWSARGQHHRVPPLARTHAALTRRQQNRRTGNQLSQGPPLPVRPATQPGLATQLRSQFARRTFRIFAPGV